MMRAAAATMGMIATAAMLLIASTAAARPLVASITPPPCVAPVQASIFVDAGSYSPAHRTGLVPGSQQPWTWNTGGVTESVTSTTIPLFTSGAKSSGSYQFTFFAAGGFQYHSSTNANQKGSVSVSLCNVPATSHIGSTVPVQYASAHHTGWVSDVQIKRPGSTTWAWLGYGLTGQFTSFTPAKIGTYYVRARLRHTTNNAASGFSPAKAVKVS